MTDFCKILPKIAKNSIRLKESGTKTSPLSTRFGGDPMLPEDFSWPYYEGETWDGQKAKRPLAFICQINLSEASVYDTDNLLPDHGILAVFYELATMKWGYDPEDRGCVRVYYFENTEKLVKTAPPSGIEDMNGDTVIIPEFSADLSGEINVPSVDEYNSDYRFWSDRLYDDYEKAASMLGASTVEDPSVIHKLLGYANLLQDDILSQCELVSRGYYLGDGEYRKKITAEEYEDALAHRDDWMLLLQLGTIGSNPDSEMMWGDMGCLYIMIRRSDLSNRDFSRIWLVLQCS